MPKYGEAKQLEVFGSQGFCGGWITSHLRGRTIESLMHDGHWLIIRFTDGHEARIGWADANGSTQNQGRPFLQNLDVKIQIAGASISGTAGM